MILRLVLPPSDADKSIRHFSVLKWHKLEGDTVAYGEALCDVWADEGHRLYRPRRPDRVLSFLGKRSSTRYLTKTRNLLLRIISSDVGVLRQVYTQAGATVEVGGLLALLTTDEDEDLAASDGRSANTSTFRVVANDVHPNSGGVA